MREEEKKQPASGDNSNSEKTEHVVKKMMDKTSSLFPATK